MAIDKGAIAYQATKEERTYQVVISIPKGADGRIIVYREVLTSADGAIISRQERPNLQRLASQLGKDQITLPDGTVITAAQVMTALPLFFDEWAVQDAAHPPPTE